MGACIKVVPSVGCTTTTQGTTSPQHIETAPKPLDRCNIAHVLVYFVVVFAAKNSFAFARSFSSVSPRLWSTKYHIVPRGRRWDGVLRLKQYHVVVDTNAKKLPLNYVMVNSWHFNNISNASHEASSHTHHTA